MITLLKVVFPLCHFSQLKILPNKLDMTAIDKIQLADNCVMYLFVARATFHRSNKDRLCKK
jgi:hypothetical protein